MKTNEKFLSEVYELVKDEYRFLDSYRGTMTKIRVRHNCDKCENYTYEVRPNDFLSGKRCPKCQGAYRMTHDDFCKEMNKLFGEEYLVLSQYKNTNTKVSLKHNICNHEWDVLPNNILKNKSKCPNCARNKRANLLKSDFNIVKEIIQKEGYILLSDNYINAHEKIQMICPENHDVEMNYNNFKSGQRCYICSKMRQSEMLRLPLSTLEEIIREHGFKIVSWENEYSNRDSKFTIECENGHMSTKSVASFIAHKGCPHCSKISKPEQRILDFLGSNNVDFIFQHRIDDCKNTYPLPFDFAVFNNDKLEFLIEYDGQQHFKPIEIFGGEKGFKRIKTNDSIKNEYCNKNNIKLHRINYKQLSNLESILEQILGDLF
ncbi:hypothetical protein [Priestia megaterium]|uniref:hypothetical protein n=1 Tax=Priestia megaterium TaxID=1404 RepID=UPI003CC6A59F